MNLKSYIFLIALLGLATSAAADSFLFLAAAKDSDLVSYRIDPQSGALSEHMRLKLPGVGGAMSLTRDGEMLYAHAHIKAEGEKQAKPHIVSIKNNRGKLEQLHLAPVSFRSPAFHVDNTGRAILASNFGGAIGVWKIDEKRRCTGESTYDEQTVHYAHSIMTDPTNRFAYSPHTKANVIYHYAFDSEARSLTPLNPATTPGPDKDHHYHEPRHYAHHPTLAMGFTANERGGGISSWKQDPQTGKLTLQETLSTLHPDWEGKSSFAGADIHITPDGRFVYVSNRDGRRDLEEGQPHGDSLAGFAIDPQTGKLKLVGLFLTERFPRSFCVDPSGHFLFAANEFSHTLTSFRIHQETGALKRIGNIKTGKTPIWVLCWSK
jgi:6-phosphogluconolactonase